MRKLRDLDVFVMHFDWYYKDDNEYYVPTEKAPSEAVDAMEKVNKMIKFDRDHNCNII